MPSLSPLVGRWFVLRLVALRVLLRNLYRSTKMSNSRSGRETPLIFVLLSFTVFGANLVKHFLKSKSIGDSLTKTTDSGEADATEEVEPVQVPRVHVNGAALTNDHDPATNDKEETLKPGLFVVPVTPIPILSPLPFTSGTVSSAMHTREMMLTMTDRMFLLDSFGSPMSAITDVCDNLMTAMRRPGFTEMDVQTTSSDEEESFHETEEGELHHSTSSSSLVLVVDGPEWVESSPFKAQPAMIHRHRAIIEDEASDDEEEEPHANNDSSFYDQLHRHQAQEDSPLPRNCARNLQMEEEEEDLVTKLKGLLEQQGVDDDDEIHRLLFEIQSSGGGGGEQLHHLAMDLLQEQEPSDVLVHGIELVFLSAIEASTTMPKQAQVYHDYGRFLHMSQPGERTEEALQCLVKSLELLQTSPSSPSTVEFTTSLAMMYEDLQDVDQAKEYYQQALVQAQQVFGYESLPTAVALSHLARVVAEENPHQALDFTRQALGVAQESDDPSTTVVIDIMVQLSALLVQMELLEEASRVMREIICLRQRVNGDEDPLVAVAMNNLAIVFKSQSRLEEAEDLLLQALDIDLNCFGQDHPEVATDLNNLGLLMVDQERYEDAGKMFHQSIQILTESYGPDHLMVASSLDNLTDMRFRQGLFSEAIESCKRAVEIRVQELGEDHPECQSTMNNLELLTRKASKNKQSRGRENTRQQHQERKVGPNKVLAGRRVTEEEVS